MLKVFVLGFSGDGEKKLWHLDESKWPVRFIRPQWPQDYSLIAALETECLDEAFVWTNEDEGWFRSEINLLEPYGEHLVDVDGEFGVTLLKAPRSTSVGDVFVTPTGEVFLIEPDGYRRIAHVT